VSNEKCVTFGPAVFAPNAFTPNNDGVNQEFQVFAPNAQQVELIIYNRWGRVIFQTNDLSVGWDGTFNGTPVQEGVYVYRLTGIGVDGSSFERSGTVTLIR
jgi:gliding motility-associated-like protein